MSNRDIKISLSPSLAVALQGGLRTVTGRLMMEFDVPAKDRDHLIAGIRQISEDIGSSLQEIGAKIDTRDQSTQVAAILARLEADPTETVEISILKRQGHYTEVMLKSGSMNMGLASARRGDDPYAMAAAYAETILRLAPLDCMVLCEREFTVVSNEDPLDDLETRLVDIIGKEQANACRIVEEPGYLWNQGGGEKNRKITLMAPIDAHGRLDRALRQPVPSEESAPAFR